MNKKKVKVLSAYEFMSKFSTKEKAIKFYEETRWQNGVTCLCCGSKKIYKVKNRLGSYQCKDCRKAFTYQTGTVFERSRIELKKWLYTAYLLQTCRKGVSSLQLSKQIGVTQKTAWFMLHRLRKACKSGSFKLSGNVKSDETYFGGKNINRHKDKKKKNWQDAKTMVQGIKADNQLKFHIIKRASKKALQGNIVKNVEAGSDITKDECQGYRGFDKLFNHFKVKHTEGVYLCPITSKTTNDLESVWLVMKRGYKGVYHHWSKKHLHRYINEFGFRLDKGNCAIDTMDRVKALVKGSENKRLTYEKLTS